ncbi:MAG: lysozyme, partial [Cyanobacteriota bacterium]|nr:lysozyme [Cyanobacteriota bacterium]
NSAWLDHALPLVRQFEGLALEAYLDPVGIPTIGYGTIRYPGGQAVQLGDRISQQRAEQLLEAALREHYGPAVFAAIPAARRYRPQQQAALISFAYNVGVGALQSSSLRRRLQAGDDPVLVITQELPRWCRGDGQVLPGLVRRRAAEVALFSSGRWQAG